MFSLTLAGSIVVDSSPATGATEAAALEEICSQAASGGTIAAIDLGGTTYCRHAFTSVGSHTFTVHDTRLKAVDYLVVAGGGGGAARDVGGGGGAGGVVSNLKPGGTNTPGLAVTPNGGVSVAVGAGGVGSSVQTGVGTGAPGADSSLGTLVAAGGGGGGDYASQGGSGGSGGGNGGYAPGATAASVANPSGQGFPGGTQIVPQGQGGGGGGGFSAPGQNGGAQSAGNGGAGGNFSGFVGTDIGDQGWFAGGGGGAQHRTQFNSSGRLGGDGGKGGGGSQPINPSSNGTNGGNGMPNTGGGAGSATSLAGTPNGNGGAGGSGIVVVRYALPTPGIALPPATQSADINNAVAVKTMARAGSSPVAPRVQGLGGAVIAEVSLTFGTLTITNLHGATATGSHTNVASATLSGTAEQVNNALDTLTVVATAEGLGTLSISATDSPRQNTATGQTIIYFSGAEIIVPTGSSPPLAADTGKWHSVSAVTGQAVRLDGFDSNVTVTIDSNEPDNVKLRLQSLNAQSPGSLTSPQGNLASFQRNSTGNSTIVINGPIAQVNSALASLEVYATDPSSARITVFASAGEGQVFDGNGHTYRIVTLNRGISWMDAFAAAAATKIPASGGGYCQGYLLTITSEAERLFVDSKVGGTRVWLGGSDQETTRLLDGESESYVVAALKLAGDSQVDADAKAVEGDFYWVTGPERGNLISSGNWRGQDRPRHSQDSNGAFRGLNGNIANYPWANGEPNNWRVDNPGEEKAHILPNGRWNDYSWNNRSVRSFVIEYGGLRATDNHQTYAGAPLGTATALREFEQRIDQNLTDPDFVGKAEPCLGVSADTNKSASFSLALVHPPAPTATLANVSGVGYTPGESNSKTDLTLNADVVADGATIKTINFEYTVSETINSDFSSATSATATSGGSGSYNLALTSIDNDRYVNYRLVVEFEGDVASITTPAAAARTLASPTVTTGSHQFSNFVNNESFTIALGGTINANNITDAETANNITAAAFLVGTSTDLSSATRYDVGGTLPGGNTPTTVTREITDLVAGQKYYFALEATNPAGTNQGAINSFSVLGVPSVQTDTIIIDAGGSATLKGLINPNLNNLSEVVFELNTDPSSDARELEPELVAISGNQPVQFSYAINDLVPGDYSFRLIAKYSLNPVTQVAFNPTTPSVLGEVVTFSVVGPNAPQNVSAFASGPQTVQITWQAPTGGASPLGYEVEVSDDGTTFVRAPEFYASDGQFALENLSPETQYSFRVVTASIFGDSPPSSVVTVTTPSLPLPPVGGSGGSPSATVDTPDTATSPPSTNSNANHTGGTSGPSDTLDAVTNNPIEPSSPNGTEETLSPENLPSGSSNILWVIALAGTGLLLLFTIFIVLIRRKKT